MLGAECKVQVPNFEFEYDLSALHNERADYVVSVPPYEYRINVCGPLVHGEGDCTGAEVGACQKKTTEQVFEKNAGSFCVLYLMKSICSTAFILVPFCFEEVLLSGFILSIQRVYVRKNLPSFPCGF